VTVEVLWVAKWGTSMFPMPLKHFLRTIMLAKHPRDVFCPDYLDQDSFFGSTGICKRLMKRENEIR